MTAPVHRTPVSVRLRLLADGAALLALCAPLGVAVLALSGMRNQYADLAAQFVVPTLVATAIGLLPLLLLRLWHSAVFGAVVALALLAAAWPQVFPAGPAPAEGAPAIRLYTANIHVENADVAAVTASVKAAQADIVMLIEVSPPVAERLDAILADYPHRAPNGVAVGSTTVIASRWPLTASPSPADGLDAVVVAASTPLGPVTLVGAHLTRPWPFIESWGQISQTAALQARLAPLSGPRIVAGDFNSVSSARIGRQIQNDIGLHPAGGLAGTWPTSAPAFVGITIDQVYASRDLAFVSRRIGRANGSDHYPVVTEITRAAP